MIWSPAMGLRNTVFHRPWANMWPIFLALSACLNTRVELHGQDSDAHGDGVFEDWTFHTSGKAFVKLNGTMLRGTWVGLLDGSTSLSLLSASSSSGNTFTGIGVGTNVKGRAQGMANLKARDGTSLRCEFIVSTISGSGFGVCLHTSDNVSRKLDLMIFEPGR